MSRWVLRLMVANAMVFFLQQTLGPGLTDALAFYPPLLATHPWTIVTYMFVHGGLWHILFNMLGLYFLGPRVEMRLGGPAFLGLYFVSGISGALLSLLITPGAAIIGASAGVFGVFLAFARYWPRERLYIWGVLPIEAWLLIVLMTVMSLFGFGGQGIAHYAHLGGFAGAFLFLRIWEYRSPAHKFRKQAAAPSVQRTNADLGALQRWARIPRERLHEVNREEVDRILDKISRSGLASLTAGERECLERFSPKEH